MVKIPYYLRNFLGVVATCRTSGDLISVAVEVVWRTSGILCSLLFEWIASGANIPISWHESRELSLIRMKANGIV